MASFMSSPYWALKNYVILFWPSPKRSGNFFVQVFFVNIWVNRYLIYYRLTIAYQERSENFEGVFFIDKWRHASFYSSLFVSYLLSQATYATFLSLSKFSEVISVLFSLIMRTLSLSLFCLLALSFTKGEDEVVVEDKKIHSVVIESCSGWRLNKVWMKKCFTMFSNSHISAPRGEGIHQRRVSVWVR